MKQLNVTPLAGPSGASQMGTLGNVLITGGAGFLGRHLARNLAKSGQHVTVLDDLSCANSTFDCPELNHIRIRCVRQTVFNRDAVAHLIGTHKTIVHFASVVGVEETISHTLPTIENLTGTMNVVRALSADQIVLFASSADVYGAHSHFYDRAMREDDYFLLENGQVNRWVYPHVKALEENLIANSAARSVVVRVFNTYGPDMDFPAPKRVIPHFIDRILSGQAIQLSGDGAQRRSFCHVDDMIRGMVLALRLAASRQSPFNTCFNLGSPDPIAIRDLAKIMTDMAVELGINAQPCPIQANAFHYSQEFDDTWNRVPDIARAREVLGYQPSVTLSEGLRKTLMYYMGRNLRPSDEAAAQLNAAVAPVFKSAT